MKRTIALKNETSRKTRRQTVPIAKAVDGDHPAWSILIPYLDLHCQLKFSQQNRHFADLVDFNAKYQLKKFRRRIKKDKYILVRSCVGIFKC